MDKIARRARRRKSIRKKVFGTPEKPRMCVHKSNKNIYIQIVDDLEGKTLCGISTKALEGKPKVKTRKNMSFAGILGEEIAKAATGKGIKKVVFDRSGYRYHGVVKAVAEAARKHGLEF
jgi:large subunit ribosomal protein L18